MRHKFRQRKMLDKRVRRTKHPDGQFVSIELPSTNEWIRDVREALGMTASQLATRLGISPQALLVREKGEARGAITLDRLEKAAHAMECRLVYAFVPEADFESIFKRQVRIKVEAILKDVDRTMRLEGQGVGYTDVVIEEITKELAENLKSTLWDLND